MVVAVRRPPVCEPLPRHATLLAGMRPQQLQMLNKSSCFAIDGADDSIGFRDTSNSMDALGVSTEVQQTLWSLLSALLLLGNVDFDSDADDHASVSAQHEPTLAAAEALLGCNELALHLISKESKRKSLGALRLSKPQAQALRDAVIKDVFVHIFGWVVARVNESIAGASGAADLPYIGLLDIFGFEKFAFNSFEQLCINFTNEKLQQFFLAPVLKSEASEHEREGVELHDVVIPDNQPVIDMLEKPPMGVFRLLDSWVHAFQPAAASMWPLRSCRVGHAQRATGHVIGGRIRASGAADSRIRALFGRQCKTPNASESGFVKAVNDTHGKSGLLLPTRGFKLREEEGFVLCHFAGARRLC